MQWINYHHLFYFMVIAEEDSISKAAKRLRLGQPTLSAQLKQFEDSLGIVLFERQHKKLILTEQGKTALEYARSIFKMGSEMIEALNDRLLPSRVHLNIGALDSIPKQLILQLTQAANKVGKCSVTLSEGKPDEMLRELAGHRVDMLLTDYLPSSIESLGIRHRLLSRRTVSLYGSPKFKKLRGDFPNSVAGAQFILPTYTSRLRYQVEQWAKDQGITMDVVVETQDIATKKLCAVEGIGLIPAGSHTVTRQVLSGDLIEIGKLSGVNEEIILLTAERRISNPIAAVLFKSFAI